MKIAVEGCCHGELDKIYQTIEHIQKEQKCKVDLLIICGDFQSVRDQADLQSMAVPPKYREMGTFYKYYSGEKKAPVLTLFIGGNHEATSYLSELPYGGWAAPNIYYMGFADVVQFNGLRIAGLSGIWKGHDYNRGHFEAPPYSNDTMRSAYHVRNLEVFRMKQISKPIDIVVTHDWPRGIYYHGNYEALIRYKPFFQSEIEENTLGNPVFEDLLLEMRPSYWFSAHLHVKFAAIVEHDSAAVKNRLAVLGKTAQTTTTTTTSKGYGKTKFLALDKCLPRRQFLQVLDVPAPNTFNATEENLNRLCLDPEWLCILKSTDHLLNITPSTSYMPSKKGNDEERHDFSPSDREIEEIFEEFGGDLKIPENFEPTVEAFDPQLSAYGNKNTAPKFCVNPQTTLICAMLGIRDITAEILKLKGGGGGGADAVSAPEALLKKTLENIDESKAESRDGDGDSDSDTEEQRLLFEALQSRRAKESESKTDEAAEFPTFIADDDDDDDDDHDDDDDDELKETLGMNRDDALKSLDVSRAEPDEESLNPLHDLSPIKKISDSTSASTSAVPPRRLTMKSVDDVIDEGLMADSRTELASEGPATDAATSSVADAATSSLVDAATSSVADTSKRTSEDEAEVQKPRKQFKRRNVALYSTLGTEDS